MHTKTNRKCPACGNPIASRSKSVRLCKPCGSRVAAAKLTSTGSGPNPSGMCFCGCGEPTALAKQSNSKTGAVRNTPQRYVQGHQSRNRQKTSPYIIDNDTGCWVWQRKITHGYAYVTVSGRSIRAARLYYTRQFGEIPDGLTIDHTCRNRACVNPEHLEAVTLAENVRRKPSTKLTMDDVRQIRKLAQSMSNAEIARRFSVDASSVSRIITGRTWREA